VPLAIVSNQGIAATPQSKVKTMTKRKRSLEEDVHAAFERACREQDFELAEHLLQALEIFARRYGNDDKLKLIYLSIASSLHESH
jgi:hypothetical protein